MAVGRSEIRGVGGQLEIQGLLKKNILVLFLPTSRGEEGLLDKPLRYVTPLQPPAMPLSSDRPEK